MNSVKDLIYFDYDKAKSLNSQLSGGIVSEITRAIEEQGGLQSEFGFDIKLLKAKVGATADEKTIKTERIELYHELFNEVENKLTDKKVLKDLNQALTTDGKSFNDFFTP